jgi:ParB family chromosome partitioning protein
MAESIDSMRRSSVEITDLPTTDIEPDPMNPNQVNEEMMAALRADILERGFVQPVLVRPHEGKWRIVDGEHRWRVLKEADADTVPCVIDDAGEDDARLRLLSMNRLRGEFVPVKLAGLLAKLASQMDEDELRQRLGMPEEEYAAALQIQNAGADVDERLAAAMVAEAAAAPEVLTWRLPVEVAEKVEQDLEARIEAGADSRAAAMIGLLG